MNATARINESTVTDYGYMEAIDAYTRGASVVPVNPKTKTPTCSWKEYQRRQATITEIGNWYEQGHRDFGVVTGNISGNFVIDIDPKGMETFDCAYLPQTHVATTPRGGLHIYHAHPGRKVTTRANFSKGIDIRGDGGLVLLPNGRNRKWRFGFSPSDQTLSPASPEVIDSVVAKGKSVQVRINTITCTETGVLPVAPVKGEFLAKWSKQEAFISAAIGLLGIPSTDFGKGFPCVLPGHDECAPSASLYRMLNGFVFYRDWHQRDGLSWYSLPDVYASQRYRGSVNLASPERAVWLLRMLVETGQMQLADVPHKELWVGASKVTQKVYDGFLFGLACRWLHTAGDPMPFAHRFAGAWCGVDKSSVANALGELLERKYIRVIGRCPGRHGKPTNLFLPAGDT